MERRRFILGMILTGLSTGCLPGLRERVFGYDGQLISFHAENCEPALLRMIVKYVTPDGKPMEEPVDATMPAADGEAVELMSLGAGSTVVGITRMDIAPDCNSTFHILADDDGVA